jgi:competence protein ComEA
MSTILRHSWQGMRVRLSSWQAGLACWAWAPIVGKTLGWLALFVGLAYVGSGTVQRLLGAVTVHELAGPPKAAAALGQSDGPAERSTDRAAGAASGETELGCSRADAGAAADSGAAGAGGAKTADGRTVLNLASEQDLESLPSIGPKRAQAIVALRAELGRFRKLEDLLRVRGIGRRLLERLRPLVVLDPPA